MSGVHGENAINHVEVEDRNEEGHVNNKTMRRLILHRHFPTVKEPAWKVKNVTQIAVLVSLKNVTQSCPGPTVFKKFLNIQEISKYS